MKTAMQELISELKRVEDYPMMSFVIKTANDLLEKEKEQIMKANMDGYKEGCTFHSFGHRPVTTEEYYRQTYNQNK
jgi:hypothetical protein